jgi:hypothetical protein
MMTLSDFAFHCSVYYTPHRLPRRRESRKPPLDLPTRTDGMLAHLQTLQRASDPTTATGDQALIERKSRWRKRSETRKGSAANIMLLQCCLLPLLLFFGK